ncbi:lipase maturation factor family protein [bacterium]|nr:lipase maturation factor family protein [bacterium]
MGDPAEPTPAKPTSFDAFLAWCRARAEAEPPFARALVRDVFLRALGLIALAAFLSLVSQVTVLYGERGILPVREYLASVSPFVGVGRVPTIFWISASDGMLLGAAWAGVLASVALTLGLAPRACLVLIWALYLSFCSVGQAFLLFQWDSFLLETVFFAIFAAPPGLRPRASPSPRPLAVFLVLWLAFRLHFESGAAKLLGGDPTWRDFTAMESYYETAPLPTWVGWYFHQLPGRAHRWTTFGALSAELVLPFLVFAGRRARAALFLVYALMHATIFVTGNYSFFSFLSVAVCLFFLDDGHLQWIAARLHGKLPERPRAPPSRRITDALLVATLLLVPLSVVPFLRFVGVDRLDVPVFRALAPYRTLNAYGLFVHMTGLRDEVVLEATQDGEHWEEYEFRYKVGDVKRAPAFVAPHQPRVDFRLWFVALREEPYYPDELVSLIRHLLLDPGSVASVFERMPFGLERPRAVRIQIYRYHFTDWKTRQATGAWWERDGIATWETMTESSFEPR